MGKQTKGEAKREVTDLLLEASEIEVRLLAVKRDAARKEQIKDRLRDICTAYPDLFEQRTTLTKGLSATVATAGVTVTYPDTQYDVDYARFRAKVGDGIFLEVFRVLKAELDLAAWARVVAEERATDQQMADCQVTLPGRKASVAIQAPKSAESVS